VIVGLGTDIIEIQRVKGSIERLNERFARRILTPTELMTYQDSVNGVSYLAKRFCIKEAAAKALGTGIGRGVSWQNMNTSHDEMGAPVLTFSGGAAERLAALGGNRIHVSVSDETHYATAVVILSVG